MTAPHSTAVQQRNEAKQWTLTLLQPKPIFLSASLRPSHFEWVEHDFFAIEPLHLHIQVLMPWIYGIIKMCYVQAKEADTHEHICVSAMFEWEHSFLHLK